MTPGALTLAIGLLDDNEIIVVERICHCWERGDTHRPGIWNGLRAIPVPDVTCTSPNVAIDVSYCLWTD